MSDTLEAVNDRTGEIVGRIHFVFGAGAVMDRGVAAVDNGVAESFVFVVYRDFRANAILATLRISNMFLGEEGGRKGGTSSEPTFISLKMRRLSSIERLRLLLSIPSIRSFLI